MIELPSKSFSSESSLDQNVDDIISKIEFKKLTCLSASSSKWLDI